MAGLHVLRAAEFFAVRKMLLVRFLLGRLLRLVGPAYSVFVCLRGLRGGGCLVRRIDRRRRIGSLIVSVLFTLKTCK